MSSVATSQPWGATPEEWLHFELVLGANDLLPVVSNPLAVISGRSTIKTLGKTPTQYDGRGRVVGIRGWTGRVSTSDEVEAWAANGDLGICIQTRELRAADVDVDDEEQAAAIRAVILRYIPDAAIRGRDGAARFVAAFVLPGELHKRILRVPGGTIEFLASGQQFIAVGTHPSGARYEWQGGLPFVFPKVEITTFKLLWAELSDRFGTGDQTDAARPRRKGGNLDVHDPVVEFLLEHWAHHGVHDGKLFVECPWKGGHSSDSGVSQSAWLIAGSRGYARGHYDCKHASCQPHTDDDFLDAIGFRAGAFQDLGPIDATDQTRGERFKVKTVAEVLRLPRPEWFVKGLLPRAGLAVVYGESGSGKTFWVLDLVLNVVRGLPWQGRRVSPGRVAYIPAEGQGGFRNRIEAYLKHHRLGADVLNDFGLITDVPNLLDDDDAAIASAVRAWGGADIIVIDTVAQTTPGANENSSEDMGRALAACRRLHEQTGALVLLVHHSGKDPTRGARGWSGLKAAADLEVEIVRSGDARYARVSKQKDGQDGARFGFELIPVHLGDDEDGELITSMVTAHVHAVPEQKRRLGSCQAAVVEALQLLEAAADGPIAVATLITKAAEGLPYDPGPHGSQPRKDRRRDKCVRALGDLMSAGLVQQVGGLVSSPQSHKPPQVVPRASEGSLSAAPHSHTTL